MGRVGDHRIIQKYGRATTPGGGRRGGETIGRCTDTRLGVLYGKAEGRGWKLRARKKVFSQKQGKGRTGPAGKKKKKKPDSRIKGRGVQEEGWKRQRKEVYLEEKRKRGKGLTSVSASAACSILAKKREEKSNPRK